MWSKAGLHLFVYFAAFWMLLACGIAVPITAVATDFFDYTGRYTVEAVLVCILASMLMSWLTLRRIKQQILRGEDVAGRMKKIEARAQRNVPHPVLRSFFAKVLSAFRR